MRFLNSKAFLFSGFLPVCCFVFSISISSPSYCFIPFLYLDKKRKPRKKRGDHSGQWLLSCHGESLKGHKTIGCGLFLFSWSQKRSSDTIITIA